MGVDGATPPGLWERVRKIAQEEMARFAKSGFLRNAAITDGGLTIRGGFLRLAAGAAGSTEVFYIGPVEPVKADGAPQQGFRVRRHDGTTVLLLRDAFPTDSGGALNQALNWFDRSGNAVLADDTDSGQGLARPYVGGGFGRARYADFSVSTASATFETLWQARTYKQQPKLEVGYLASMDTAGTTGEVRLMVNGTQVGATVAQQFGVGTHTIGPAVVAGAHMAPLTIEIQGRRTSASGAIRVEAQYWTGRQT